MHEILLEKKNYISDTDIVEEIKNEGYVSPRATKAYKEFVKKHNDFFILPPETFLSIERWLEQIHVVELLRDMFISPDSRYKEISIFAICPRTKLVIKCRPDIMNLKAGMISDVKSSAGREDWSNTVEKYGYEIQAMFYLYVMQCFFGDKRISLFPFVVFQKSRPFSISIKSCGAKHLECGGEIVQNTLKNILKSFKKLDFGIGFNKEIEFSEPSYRYIERITKEEQKNDNILSR